MNLISRLFFSSLWVLVLVNAQDVWTSIYSTSNCATSSLATEQAVPLSGCVQYSAGAVTLSLNFQCVGTTEDSGWSASVYSSGDCSGVTLATYTGTDACDCQGQSLLFGQVQLGVSASCTGVAPVTCSTVSLAPSAAPPPDTGPTVWTSVYSSSNCATSTLLGEQAVPSTDTCVEYSSGAITLSLNFQCVGTTEDSGWSASVYLSGDCSGSALTSFTGSDACDCQGQSLLFGQVQIGVSVSCTGAAATSCQTVTSAPTVTPQAGTPVWGALYTSLDCDTDTFVVDGVVDIDNSGCLTAPLNGVDVSMSFACAGFTSDSSWSADMFLSSDCSGIKLFTLSAADACTCGGLSLSGYTLGAHVNCGGGVEPTCDDGGDGSNSNGDGSDSGMDSDGVALTVGLVVGFVVTCVLMGAVYHWKCRNKDERLTLSDDDGGGAVAKNPLFRSEGEQL